MTDNRSLLILTADEKQELERWSQSRTLPAGDVFRARLILALAEGQSYREIQKRMQTRRLSRVGMSASNTIDWPDSTLVIKAAGRERRRPRCRRAWCAGYNRNRTTAALTGPAGHWPASWA